MRLVAGFTEKKPERKESISISSPKKNWREEPRQEPGNFPGFLTWPETRSQPPRMRNARRMPKTGPEFHYYLPRPRPFLRIKREERRGRSKPRLQLVQFPPAASSHPTYPRSGPVSEARQTSLQSESRAPARAHFCAHRPQREEAPPSAPPRPPRPAPPPALQALRTPVAARTLQQWRSPGACARKSS